ncbi:hypothetical protein MNV49_006253 [Pseudohyphozyma bogoriensis]|nr:hypothetical protein MNV49_006253 [Pseudohyphozyma bogoriensis]
MSFDPLGSSDPSPARPRSSLDAQPSPDVLPNLSPLAPRPPLPGQTGLYRAQPLPPPPSGTPPPPHDAWGSPPSTPTPSQWANSPSPAAPRSTMTPRSPQAYTPTRERIDREDGGRGGHGGAGMGGEVVVRPPPPDAFVRIRIMALEKNRRDVYIKFNAESNLPTFRNSTYRSVSRSHAEFVKFADVIAGNNPQSIVPALPLVQTSAQNDAEDDRLIKAAYQKWVARVTMDPATMKDDEMRNFIESEFGVRLDSFALFYTPSSRARRKTPSTFHFPRGSKLPGEQDDELTLAKAAMGKLELQFNETAKAVDKVAKTRRAYALASLDLAEHVNTFATTETYAPLANGMRKLSRTTKVSADLLANQASSEMVSLGDALNYQSMNARSAKETLLSRDVIVDEHRAAAKATISKRRNIERLKGSSSIRPEKVDEALEELDDAKRHETLCNQRLHAISQNLQPSLRTHSIQAHQDILTALIEHSRSQLMHEKMWLKELELVRPELHKITNPTAGVIYHASTSEATATPPRTSSAMGREGSRGSSQGAQSPPLGRGTLGKAPMPRTPSDFGNGGPLSPTSSIGPATMAQGDVRKRSIHSMAKSVQIADDRRQKVDARMAASMLANGF